MKANNVGEVKLLENDKLIFSVVIQKCRRVPNGLIAQNYNLTYCIEKKTTENNHL